MKLENKNIIALAIRIITKSFNNFSIFEFYDNNTHELAIFTLPKAKQGQLLSCDQQEILQNKIMILLKNCIEKRTDKEYTMIHGYLLMTNNSLMSLKRRLILVF